MFKSVAHFFLTNSGYPTGVDARKVFFAAPEYLLFLSLVFQLRNDYFLGLTWKIK